jgi:hypothetical protein
VLCAATTLDFVQSGQSGQPSPDEESRTAAPVEMITALAITEDRANRRSDRIVGAKTGAAIRASQEDTRPMVTLPVLVVV